MKLNNYLKDKLLYILVNIIVFIVTGIILFLCSVSSHIILIIEIMNIVSVMLFYFKDYTVKSKYYNELNKTMERLDKKYLVTEVINKPDFEEGKIFYEILQTAGKSMNDKIAKSDIDREEYREYVELWVHEIKTPIAATKLLIDNNHNEITDSINEEITKVEGFIEQALFYSKSNSLEKDYIIKKIDLKNPVNSAIRRNANTLISKKIKIETEGLDKEVYADTKWIEFIVNQIITNSIKYMDKEDSLLSIRAKNKGEEVVLEISDNGIGISEKSLPKVFEKGYTGENGRRFGKSTGMGLYLCRKLCTKLGLGINISSEVENGTVVSILFPHNNYMNVD